MPYRRQRRPRGLALAIRRMRRRLNLSQIEFAAEFGLRAYLIAKWELGYHPPSTGNLIRLLRLANTEERLLILKGLESRGVDAADLSVATAHRSPGGSPLPEGGSSSAALAVAAGPARGPTDAGSAFSGDRTP